MAIAQAPSIEDEIVARDLHEGLIQLPPRLGRQNHVVECALRDDSVDDAAWFAEAGENAQKRIRHPTQRNASSWSAGLSLRVTDELASA